jgi:protein-tyrosine-phosphatase
VRAGAGHFRAFSACSQPIGHVDPLTLKVLESFGYPTDGMRSKNWEEFAAPGAPILDFVFTLCDYAAGERCPIWPGQPMTAHWPIPDPAAIEECETQREAAFVTALYQLKSRITIVNSLPIAAHDRMTLGTKLRQVGHITGHTSDC